MEQESTTFVWYATHEKHGSLILAVPSVNGYQHGYVYSPKMIGERLGKRKNALVVLELSVGPLGVIPRHLYEEAGAMVTVPGWLRDLALMDELRQLCEIEGDHFGAHDERISSFILEAWEKVYKGD
jgi:hypothetical protein